MRVRELSEAEFLAAGGRWDALLAASAADSFFLTHRWLAGWWRRFGSGKDLVALEVEADDGALLGFAPLCISRVTRQGLLPVREIGFLGREKTTGDYLDLAARPGLEAAVLAAVVDCLLGRGGWDALAVTDVPEDSATLARVAAIGAARGLAGLPGPDQVCPYLPLPASWDDFLAGASANLRSNLKRREKKLLAMGASFVDRASDPATLPGALDALFALHGARWETKGRTGNFIDPRVRAFHHDLAPALAADGALGFWTCEIEGRPVAALYGFVHRGRFLYYQAGLDPAFAEHGAGFALMGHAIRESVARGLTEFDYLRGDEDYKRRWTDQSRRTESWIALRPGWLSVAWRALHSARAAARQLLPRL